MYTSGNGTNDLLGGYRRKECESTYVRERYERGGLHLWEKALQSQVRTRWESASSVSEFCDSNIIHPSFRSISRIGMIFNERHLIFRKEENIEKEILDIFDNI